MSKEPSPYMLDYIKKYFTYDSNTGIISRTDRANSNGSYDKDGYLILKIKTRQFKSHRIAWFLYYGEFPINLIDHINGDRTDNRIENLRDVEYSINNNNTFRKKNKDTGVLGVYFDRTKGLRKNYATWHNKKVFRFYTIEEAINFREENGLPTKEKIR
jgi:hypothetical protein